MIALHGVLLEHAERLRLSGAELNYEADLRRSASAAYYALLHILVYDTVHFLFPDQTQEAEESRCVTSRRFDHKTTQQFAKSIIGTNSSIFKEYFPTKSDVPGELVDISRAILMLYDDRIDADYVLRDRFRGARVDESVRAARFAFQQWQTLMATDKKSADGFMMALYRTNKEFFDKKDHPRNRRE